MQFGTDEVSSFLEIQELIAGCLDGDDQAKAYLFAEYSELVRRAVFRKLSALLGQRPLQADVEDVCGEVFTRLYANGCQALRQLRRPRSIYAWLVAIAQNHCVDYVRKWGNPAGSPCRVEMAREAPAPYAKSSEEQAMATERRCMVDDALAQLPTQDRLIFEFFYVDGLKYTEIAQMMGMNINTASARLRRAKTKLRKVLEDRQHELSN
jgi:RNA polymerase sigma factor (sigma-70 family)